MYQSSNLTLFTPFGDRKYLTPEERYQFLQMANLQTRDIRMYCSMLYYTGMLPSEALALRIQNIDLDHRCVVIETRKKRSCIQKLRSVPLPDTFLGQLNLVFEIAEKQKKRKSSLELL